MYRLEYLPVAQKDMIEIVKYISEELQNSDAANHLATELIHAAESVTLFRMHPLFVNHSAFTDMNTEKY